MAANAGQSNDSAGNASPHRIMQLTGKVWQSCSEDAKLAILFGVELGMQACYASYGPKNDKEHTMDKSVMSPFDKAWYESFKDMTLLEIVQAVDSWYAANPDKTDVPVLVVIWTEVMKRPVPAR